MYGCKDLRKISEGYVPSELECPLHIDILVWSTFGVDACKVTW